MEFDQFNNQDLLSSIAGDAAAQALIQRFGNLTNLAQASFDELTGVPGIGQSRAKAIKSAFLLAQRLSRESYADAPLLDTPERVANLLREEYRLQPVEAMSVLLLNTRRRLISASQVSLGSVNSVPCSPVDVFFPAISKRASAIILVHNHPSGVPTPSEADIRVTRELIRAGMLLKIEVLDHIILGRCSPEWPKDFVSLRELGYCSL